MNSRAYGMHSPFPVLQEGSPLQERLGVVALVVVFHLSAFAAYWMQPTMPRVLVNEMSVSFANMQMQQDDVVRKPKSEPRPIEPAPAETPVVKEEPPPVLQDATPPSKVLLDAEPDYRADYLDNPRPPYPLEARRRGMQGRVVIDVEVLDSGSCGQVRMAQGSGFMMLDNAALQTVKSWRFVPARQAGRAVTMWIRVPIFFSLSDSGHE